MANMNVQGEKPATFFTEIELTDEQLESISGGFGRDDEPHHAPGNEQHHESSNEQHHGPREEGWYDEHHRWHRGHRHGHWNRWHQWVWDNY